MDCVRTVTRNIPKPQPCEWCESAGNYWDRIGGRSCCPDCEEALVAGEADPLVVRTESHRCAVCHRLGTVPYLTFPLHTANAIALDLCVVHFRALLGRSLGPAAFQQIRRQLQAISLKAEQVFLLHEVFYDEQGRALQPVLLPGE